MYTKSIYYQPDKADGIRICVMSRLTEINGITPVRELVEGKLFDYWAKILAPPENLVGRWYKKVINWKDFTQAYLDHLTKPEIQPHVQLIANTALQQDLTLLCTEWDHKHCHRSILAAECQRLEPRLKVVHS